MRLFTIICILLCLISYARPADEKQNTNIYINKYCSDRGNAFARIQKNIIVDCLTDKVLWKISFAEDWQSAMTDALTYKIYDDYRGEPEYAPDPGVILVQTDVNDYKYMVKLQQLVKFYKLPLKLDTIEDYGYSSKKYTPDERDSLHLGKIKLQLKN